MNDNETRVIAVGDVVISEVHPVSECAGRFCWIDSPSPHPLRDAAIEIDAAARVIYRVCHHRGRHPDPDDAAYRRRLVVTRHPYSWAFPRDPHECCDRLCCVGGEPTDEDRAEAARLLAEVAAEFAPPSDGGMEILRRIVRDRLDGEGSGP